MAEADPRHTPVVWRNHWNPSSQLLGLLEQNLNVRFFGKAEMSGSEGVSEAVEAAYARW